MKKNLKHIDISWKQALELMSEPEVWEWFQTSCDLYDSDKDYIVQYQEFYGWNIYEIIN